ncbi:hypothetical protein M3G46_10920, partial [Corynebacterium sanguinis]|uniref:hypothetical protein n=1 Tax=Corynebacterium sanguinis TaxID=2594913 RepID=UPI0021A5F568
MKSPNPTKTNHTTPQRKTREAVLAKPSIQKIFTVQPQHRPCASDEENHTTHASNRATPAIHYDQTAHHDTKRAPQGDIAIKGSRHHHQHTPTHTTVQARHATMHTTTNHKQKQKSTLAHYRVLTQHT